MTRSLASIQASGFSLISLQQKDVVNYFRTIQIHALPLYNA